MTLGRRRTDAQVVEGCGMVACAQLGVVLLAVDINSPRFDTPWRAILNVAGIALWIAAIVSIISDRRRGRHVPGWGWIAILVNIAIEGVYLPLGPIAWLAARALDNRGKDASGTPDA
jgi:hypothetical protein